MSMDQANQLAIPFPEGWRPCFFVTKVSIFITVEQESAKAHTDTVGLRSAINGPHGHRLGHTLTQ